ncbi:LuxR family transcriptional regulator [Streptomyces sp. TRM68367]|uniref:response regulator transcription factor n=1 Tax=Streptomyces sp. TRM68367 TaxID=2758415 RepID=UPI00165CBEBE|nr:LuxR C-terminal-related transcriptional regulator [Streptomyces sp. TRM68367]MBC9730534.1 response regulator transcription factor [Streptomyces sp. TRM68367]
MLVTRAVEPAEREHGSKISVVVHASDPVSGEGAVALLRSSPGITLLGPERRHEADVVLVTVHRTTEDIVCWMERAADESTNPEMRMVLVAETISEHHLMRAVGSGLVSFLFREEADRDRVVRTIRGSRRDRALIPEQMVGWLLEQVKTIQRTVLVPNGLTIGGLHDREVEVLKLLADGMDTTEIAQHLNYSERTIKNIISGMLTRLNLRNRSHAVAYAMRCGVL